MGIWRDLREGMARAAVGLHLMARDRYTKEEIEELSRWLEEQPEYEERRDINEQHEEYADERDMEGPDLGYRYMGDGRILTYEGEEIGSWSPGTPRRSEPDEPEPDYSDYEPPGYSEPEPGTNEWHYKTGNYVDPEPDWSTDPAIDERTGTRYYSNGRVVDGFGREIEPGYTPEQIEAQRRAAREYPETGYPDIERAPF